MEASISIVSKKRLDEVVEVTVKFIVSEGPDLPPQQLEEVFRVQIQNNISDDDMDRLALAQARNYFDNHFPVRG